MAAKKSSSFLSNIWNILVVATFGCIFAWVHTNFPDFVPSLLEIAGINETVTEDKNNPPTPVVPKPVTPKPAPPKPSVVRPKVEEEPLPKPEKMELVIEPTGSKSALVVSHSYYTVGYNSDAKNPEWVAYQLTKKEVLDKDYERTGDFRPDTKVSSGTALPEDYRGTGYDRGHLIPAADRAFSMQAMSETFLMSNMSPQVPGFNRGIWKELEQNVRDWARKNDKLYVVTGPVLAQRAKGTIGKVNKVLVPRSFYKVILDYSGPEIKAIGFILPNADSDNELEDYVRSIDEIELATGLNFFPKLSKAEEKTLESKADVSLWICNKTRAKQRIQEASLRLSGSLKLAAE